MTLPIAFRDGTDADAGLIFSSWLRSYYDARPPAIWDIQREVYFADSGHHGVVERILRVSRVLIAHPPDDPDEVYGWACGGAGLLHYVYVKELWRRKGVATRLVAEVAPGPTLTVSHRTKSFVGLADKYQIAYDPYRRGDT